MEIKKTTDPAFAKYGCIISGYDFTALLDCLRASSDCPDQGTIYTASFDKLESLPVAEQIKNNAYGGMPIEIGYCNGNNSKLNCLEYHRGSELDIAADKIILLLAQKQCIKDGKLDTKLVEAFEVPAGQGVLIYETTLHFAPCTSRGSRGFRVVIVLPKGTNTQKPEISRLSAEDDMLWSRNKWLLAHPDSPDAKNGAYIGLVGENISVS
jgi:hypothetical protein